MVLHVGFKQVIKEETQKNRYEKVSLPPTGETLSLLVLRTAPGLGNVTVDWTLEGPFVPRTFSKSSGTLFFTKVNPKITALGGVLVAPQAGCDDPPSPTDRLFLDPQGQLNDTIHLQLLDDATPEDKDEYTVSLSDIRTFGNAALKVSCGPKRRSRGVDVPLTPVQVWRAQATPPWTRSTARRSSPWTPATSPTAFSASLRPL